MSTALAQPFSLTEASGDLAPGVVEGGEVQVAAEGFIQFGTIGTWAGTLMEPTVIEGIPCAAAPVRVEFGHLDRCTLSRDATIDGVVFPEAAQLEVIAGRTPQPVFRTTLPRPVTVKGRTYPAGEELAFADDGAVWFRIRSATAEPDVPLPCRFGHAEDRVLLHPDGALAQCILREEATVSGHRLPVNTIVVLHPDGQLARIDLREEWQGHGSGSRILFGEDGAVREVRSKSQVYDDDRIGHPSWWVRTGFYYGYPWGEVLGSR